MRTFKKWLPALAACLAAMAVFAVCAAFGRERRETERLVGPFRPYLRQYVLAGSPGVTRLPDPVKAVVLVCDNQGEPADSVYHFGVEEMKALPDDMRAKTPEEVNTVIRINKVYIRVRRSGGGEAYALRAYVTVVNMKTDTYWVQNRMFYSAAPEEGKKGFWGRKGKAVAEVGMEVIIEFLKQ